MRIVSLLPSATEILFALGAGPDVVGVSHECDFPAAAAGLPVLTRPCVPTDGRSPAQIDRDVSDFLADGRSVYDIDRPLLRRLAPDLIVTQALCEVCAVGRVVVAAADQGQAGRADAGLGAGAQHRAARDLSVSQGLPIVTHGVILSWM